MTSGVLRSAQAGAILTALGVSAGLMTGVAEAVPSPREHSCASPIFTGPPAFIDANLRYNVKERIIGPPSPAADDTPSLGCLEAFTDEEWVRVVPPWITKTDDDSKKFKDNFVSARYVIDQGTDQEKTVTVGKNVLFKGTVPDVADLLPAWIRGLPYIVPVSPVFPALKKLGKHTTILYVTMSQETCNGLPGDVGDMSVPTSPPAAPGLNKKCLPKDESVWPSTAVFDKDTGKYNPVEFTVSNPPS